VQVQRLGQVLGDYTNDDGGHLDFAIPDDLVVAGDKLVVLILGEGGTPAPTTAPSSAWQLFATADAPSGPRHAELWSVLAAGDEAGTTLVFPSAGSQLVGVLVAYRGSQVMPPQVPDPSLDSLLANRTIGTVDHAALAVDGTASEDRRLLLWWVQSDVVTIAEAVADGFTSFGKILDDPGWVTAGELLAAAPGAAGALTVVSNAVANGVEASVTLRARAIAQPDGFTNFHPGTIGLDLDGAAAGAQLDETGGGSGMEH
jgi:hypothetical protein